jgi:hypothetical protein
MLLWTANLRRMVVGGERLSVRTAREQRGAGVPLTQISSKRLVGSWCAIITECRQVLVNEVIGEVHSDASTIRDCTKIVQTGQLRCLLSPIPSFD